MAEAPDEVTHLWVVNYLRTHWQLPSNMELMNAGYSGVYGSLPQLGYLPHVLLSAPVGEGQSALFARFGSLLMGLVAVWAAFRTGELLFRRGRYRALVLPALVVVHPQFVFVNSYTNNDSTTAGLAAVAIYLLVDCIRNGVRWKKSLLLGLILGWMALCKFSGYAMLVISAFAVVAAGLLNAQSWSLIGTNLAVVLSVVLGLSGWWFVRNYNEFGGDILGTKTMYRTWALQHQKELNYQIPVWQVLFDKSWWRMFYFSYWGVFGFMTRYLWRPIYFVFVGLLVASVGGWIKSLYRREPMERKDIAIWIMMLSCCLINIAGMVFASTTNLGGPQGRYFFVSEIPFLALLIEGLARLGEKSGRLATLILLAYTTAVCLGAWAMLFMRYGFHINAY